MQLGRFGACSCYCNSIHLWNPVFRITHGDEFCNTTIYYQSSDGGPDDLLEISRWFEQIIFQHRGRIPYRIRFLKKKLTIAVALLTLLIPSLSLSLSGGRTWSPSLIWMQMATTRSQKMCLGYQVSVPQLHKNRRKNPRVQRKGVICRCSRWWFSTIFFSFSLLLEEFFSNFDVRSIIFKNGLVGEKPPTSCDFWGFRGPGFCPSKPSTPLNFCSKTSHSWHFWRVFFGENSRILGFWWLFFFCGAIQKLYIYIIYVYIYIYLL